MKYENFDAFANAMLKNYDQPDTGDNAEDIVNLICTASAKVTLKILREYHEQFNKKSN